MNNGHATQQVNKSSEDELEISAARSCQQIENLEASAAQLRQELKEMETKKQLQHQKYVDSASLVRNSCEKDMEHATLKHKQEVQYLQDVVAQLRHCLEEMETRCFGNSGR